MVLNKEQIEKEIHEILSDYLVVDKKGFYVYKINQHDITDIVNLIIATIIRNYDFLHKVKHFHAVFNHPIKDEPFMNREQGMQRYGFIKEELEEYKSAIEANDIVGVLDVFIDLIYFILGGVIQHGLSDLLLKGFEEVHDSNMTKACQTESELELTIDKYTENGVEVYSEKSKGYSIVKRKSDNKILKSVGYKEADLTTIVNTYLAKKGIDLSLIKK